MSTGAALMWPSSVSLPSADIAVVEMTDAFRQLSLFYHLGVRESFSMANNIILYCDTNSDSLQSLQVSGRGTSPEPSFQRKRKSSANAKLKAFLRVEPEHKVRTLAVSLIAISVAVY